MGFCQVAVILLGAVDGSVGSQSGGVSHDSASHGQISRSHYHGIIEAVASQEIGLGSPYPSMSLESLDVF